MHYTSKWHKAEKNKNVEPQLVHRRWKCHVKQCMACGWQPVCVRLYIHSSLSKVWPQQNERHSCAMANLHDSSHTSTIYGLMSPKFLAKYLKLHMTDYNMSVCHWGSLQEFEIYMSWYPYTVTAIHQSLLKHTLFTHLHNSSMATVFM